MLTPKLKKQLEDTLNDMVSKGATMEQLEEYAKKFREKFREKFDNNETLSTELKKQLEDTLKDMASKGATMEQIEEYAKKFREKFTKKQSSVYGWDKYPCVVELAKSKGVSLDNDGAYLIGDFRYYANGRKGILSTGNKAFFTCDDPEFKKSSGSQSSGSQSSGSQSSGSQPVSGGRQSTQIPLELKDIKGVKKFQDWLDVNHPGWHRKYGTLNQNLLRGYGKYGPNTTRAWNNQSIKDEYLKTSNSNVVSNSQVTSNWKDAFPSCVKGLKGFYNPPNNYFLGFGTDTKGVQYRIAYFSTEYNTGKLCVIYNDGEEISRGYYSCTTNNQQITIKTLIGLSITGSVINPDSGDITLPKNDDETLEPSDDDVLKDNKVIVSKKTGV